MRQSELEALVMGWAEARQSGKQSHIDHMDLRMELAAKRLEKKLDRREIKEYGSVTKVIGGGS